MNRTEAVHLKADILAKVRQAFTPPLGEYSEVEIFRETAGQIMLRARKVGAYDQPVMLMVTVTELRSWPGRGDLGGSDPTAATAL